MVDSDACVEQSRLWVETFIHKEGICPFAGQVIKDNGLQYECIQNLNLENTLIEIYGLLHKMHTAEDPETCLVILPDWQSDFDEFLELCDIARAVLAEYELTAIFQFATFHPLYLFENEAPESASHYTNRSPWPMLHILRQDSISQALLNYPHPEEIPARNIKLMHRLGAKKLASQLASIQAQ